MCPEFEWDPPKEAANRAKHGIGFDEAKTAFDDPMSQERRDPDGSPDEDRWILVGWTRRGRLVVVAWTEREGSIRLVSARPATRRERHEHEDR